MSAGVSEWAELEHQLEIKPFVELESSLQWQSLKPPTQPLRAAHP
ncbi:uncharacterized, partial [Tachysurus ichikawai]